MAEKLFDLPMETKALATHPDGFVPHAGREEAFNKSELETDLAEVKESRRKITDCKVSLDLGGAMWY